MEEVLYEGFKRINFEFEGMEAFLIFPNKPNEGKNWILKTEYFDAFPDLQIEMVKRGWHLAYVKNATRWCLPEDIERKKRFCIFLSEEYGLSEKCVPVGMSCGGMIGVKFAAKYPEFVSALYLDAPVMNFLSCPFCMGAATHDDAIDEFINATGIDKISILSYREHPIDKMHLLIKNNIPVVLVYGDSDVVVPYEENGALLEKCYKENGGIIEVYGKKGCGHHPHGLPDNTPVIDFILKYGGTR